MNEVTNTQLTTGLVVGSASSKGVAKHQQLTPAAETHSGKQLPLISEQTAENAVGNAGTETQLLEDAVASINDFVQSLQRDLQFSVDAELDRTIIKVIDSESGNIIRQIPEDIFLELARKLKNGDEFQLVSALS